MAEIKPKIEVIGTVPVKYTQNQMMLHEPMASGEIEGKTFTVNNAYGQVYVTFDDLKGSIPKIAVDVRDLVQAAYDLAKEKNLFK